MDNQKLWLKALDKIRPQTSSANFRTFFASSRIESMENGRVVLAVPNAFIKQTILERHLSLIESALKDILDTGIAVELTVKSPVSDDDRLNEEDFFQPTQTPNSYLNSKYTLENFVVGLSNNVAYAAAQAVIQNPGTSYNPLFIYGGTGVGKTHLMLGIGNAILQKKPLINIIYCSSEQFTNDFVLAIQTHKMLDLRRKYRQTQILLIDDVQFFSGRDSTQEEFFHTFNELQTKNAQMIITSDRPPNEIAKMEDRLRSRFAGGLMVDIQQPDFDTRVAILKAKSDQWGSVIAEDALKLIAQSSEASIRELEGKLMQILQSLKAKNLEATPENIASFLSKAPQKKLSLTYKEVLSFICRYFDLTSRDLIGPKRQKELVLPRHITMHILAEDLGLTVEKIGQIMGGRDHTTVMHARDKITQLIQKDREMQKIYIDVKQQLFT